MDPRQPDRPPAQSVSRTLTRPWLSSEKVSTKDGRVYIGYTLDTAAGWHILLKESDRAIVYIPSDEVKSRQVCRLPVDVESDRREHRPFVELRRWKAPTAPLCDGMGLSSPAH